MQLPLDETCKKNCTAIYVRVSGEEQVDGYSLDAQEQALRAETEGRGRRIYRVYREEGVSGAKERRSCFDVMMNDARAGKFDEIIVWNISRFSRKMTHLLASVEELQKHGVAFRSLSENFDLTTPIGIFALTMMGSIGEMQRESWMESSRIGMEKRHRSGRHNGICILGYCLKVDEDDKRGGSILIPVEEEADTVRQIFELYATGLGFKAIANRMNLAGKCGKNGSAFSTNTISGILRNSHYCGKVRFAGEWAEGLHQPIIDKELWDEVASRLTKNRRMPKQYGNSAFWLSGLLCCPDCGKGMIPAHSKAVRKDGSFRFNHYYVCGNYMNKGRSVCKANSVRADVAERTVIRWLSDFLQSPFWLKRVWTKIDERKTDKEAELQAMNIEIRELEGKKNSIFLSYETGKTNQDEFMEKMSFIKKKIEKLRQEVLERQERSDEKSHCSFAQIKQAFSNLLDVLKNSPEEKRKRLICGLVRKILVKPDRKTLQVQVLFPDGVQSMEEDVLLE